jgi:hypothetical protein
VFLPTETLGASNQAPYDYCYVKPDLGGWLAPIFGGNIGSGEKAGIWYANYHNSLNYSDITTSGRIMFYK